MPQFTKIRLYEPGKIALNKDKSHKKNLYVVLLTLAGDVHVQRTQLPGRLKKTKISKLQFIQVLVSLDMNKF